MGWEVLDFARSRQAAHLRVALFFVCGLLGVTAGTPANAACDQTGSTVSCTGTTANYDGGTQTNLTITVESGATVSGIAPTDAIRIQNSSGITGNALINNGTIDGFVTILSVNPGTDSFTNHGVLKVTDPNSPLQQHSMAGSSFVQSSSGTLMARVDANGFNDGIFSRTATLAGRFVAVIQSGIYTSPMTYTGVINTSAGVTGTFDSVTSSSPFFSAALATVGNNVDLTITRIPFNAVSGLTPNQIAVANALEPFYAAGPTGDAATLLGNLVAATSVSAFDQLSGAGTTAAQDASFSSASLFGDTMLRQGLSWLNGTSDVNSVTFGRPIGYAAAPKGEHESKRGHDAFAAMRRPDAAPSRWRAWGNGFAGTRATDGQASTGSADQSTNVFGGAFGADRRITADFLAGFAVGGSRSHFSVDSLSTGGRADAAHLGFYAVHTFGPAYLAATLHYARVDTSVERTITGIGTTEYAKGRFASDQLGGRLEFGWKQAQRGYSLTPFVAIEPTALWQRAYTESSTTVGGGPGLLGLSYGANTVTSFPTYLGAQFDMHRQLDNGQILSPYLRASWVHEFNPDRSIHASFISIPGAGFTVDGARAAADAARIETGATLAFQRGSTLFVNVASEVSGRSRSFAGLAGARMIW